MNYCPAVLALALLLQPASGEAASAGPPAVQLPSASQARLGVRVQRLAAVSMPRVVAGFARVLDTGSLAALDAEIGAARAAATASNAELRRVQGLAAADQAASARSVDAARAQAEADDARATLASRRLGLEWGPGLARQTPAARSQLLRDLARGDSALLRIDLLSRVALPSRPRLRVYPDAAARPVGAAALGPAASADARLQTPGILAVVRGAEVARLPAGLLVRAEAESASADVGTVLPRGALIRSGGAVWAYVQTGPEVFVRRRLADARPVATGWFVASGFRAGDMVVAEGAATLFAAEVGGDAE
jgi:hypothetical protein